VKVMYVSARIGRWGRASFSVVRIGEDKGLLVWCADVGVGDAGRWTLCIARKLQS
jgi:hypothetical protein